MSILLDGSFESRIQLWNCGIFLGRRLCWKAQVKRESSRSRDKSRLDSRTMFPIMYAIHANGRAEKNRLDKERGKRLTTLFETFHVTCIVFELVYLMDDICFWNISRKISHCALNSETSLLACKQPRNHPWYGWIQINLNKSIYHPDWERERERERRRKFISFIRIFLCSISAPFINRKIDPGKNATRIKILNHSLPSRRRDDSASQVSHFPQPFPRYFPNEKTRAESESLES